MGRRYYLRNGRHLPTHTVETCLPSPLSNALWFALPLCELQGPGSRYTSWHSPRPLLRWLLLESHDRACRGGRHEYPGDGRVGRSNIHREGLATWSGGLAARRLIALSRGSSCTLRSVVATRIDRDSDERNVAIFK